MSRSTHDTTRGDDDLGRLALEVERRLGEGLAVEASALAQEFGVPLADAEEVLEAVAAVGDALFEPLTGAGAGDVDHIPAPNLPDDYELVGELGRGGMGIVYRAHQKSLGRDVAIKVLRPGELTFSRMLQRFEQEAKSLARLKHPHIVAIHEVGQSDGCVYFTMDLVEGRPLSELVAERQVTPTEAVRLLRQVTSAIAYTHGHGVIHRDLKPANILVDQEGRAYVVDFGLARDLKGPDELTRTGQVIGTANYMSPEQARGDKARIGEATDVYALGAVLYECLTGKPPFHGKGLAELMSAILNEDPLPPTKVDPRVPKALETICRKSMTKEPERRYATARALLDDLERFEEGRTIRARPPGTLAKLRGMWQRHWRVASVGAAAAIVAGLAVLLLLLPKTGETIEGLEESAKNLAREEQYAAAATVMERAIALTGARVPRDGRTARARPAVTAPSTRVRRRLIRDWAGYLSRNVRKSLEGERFDEAMDAATRTQRDVLSLMRATGDRVPRHRVMEVLWLGALAAARTGDASAPMRFAELYRFIHTDATQHPGNGLALMHGGPLQMTGALRRHLGEILATPADPLHPHMRRLLSALLTTRAGREVALKRWHAGSGMNRMYRNPLDLIQPIIEGTIRQMDGRPVDAAPDYSEDVIDAAWFDVAAHGWRQAWQDTRNLLRRMAAHDPERVQSELLRLATAADLEPLVRRWATGLLAIALDLPPWWDREAQPTDDDEIRVRVLRFAKLRRSERGQDFLRMRVEAAIATAFETPGTPTDTDRRMDTWLHYHTGANLGIDVVQHWPSGVRDWGTWAVRHPGYDMAITIRRGFARIDPTIESEFVQDMLEGLATSPLPDSFWHNLLINDAEGDVHRLLWAPGIVPSPTDGLGAGDESVYDLWAVHLGSRQVTPPSVNLSQHVSLFANGTHQATWRRSRHALLDVDAQALRVGTGSRIYAGWTNRTAWPEGVLSLQSRLGLGGLTYHPRRRMISEPGLGLVNLRGTVRALSHPDAPRLRLVADNSTVRELADHQARWTLVSRTGATAPAGGALVLRFERRTSSANPAPSQSAVLVLGIDGPEAQPRAGRIGRWAIEQLRADLAANELVRISAQDTARAEHLTSLLRALLYTRLNADELAGLRGLRESAWPEVALPVHVLALDLILAIGADQPALARLLEEEPQRIEDTLLDLDQQTFLARLETWQRLLAVTPRESRRAIWREIYAVADVALTQRRNAHLDGMWVTFAQAHGAFATDSAIWKLYARAQATRKAALPPDSHTWGPAILALAGLGLVLLLLLIVAAAKGRVWPRVVQAALGVGWLLSGQQVFFLPDMDVYIELLGILLMWKAAHGLEAPSWRTTLGMPGGFFMLAFFASVIQRAGGDGEVFGRIAIGGIGFGLVALAFHVDRLSPQSTNRARWVLVTLAALLLVPTTFIGIAQGPTLDQYAQGQGLYRIWSELPTTPLFVAHIVGAVCVVLVVTAYARRLATSLRAPREGRRGSRGTS